MSDSLEFFRIKHFKTRQDKELYQSFRLFCKEHEPEGDYYYKFGYETFGVVLYKLCTWIMENLDEEGINQVFFFSRDGLIIKRAFELISGHEKYNTEYVYVSRRSLRVPTLWFQNLSRYEAIFPTRYITIEDMISSVGLNPSKYRSVIQRFGFELEDVIKSEDIKDNQFVIQLLDDIWEDVIKNSKNEYDSIEKYIKTWNPNDQVAVVDIGWRGTMQNYLSMLLSHMEIKSKLRGYYLTLNSDHVFGISMRGYISNVTDKSKGCDLLRGYVGLIETLFMCSDGSTRNYEINEFGRVYPVKEECEYMEDGKLSWEAESVNSIQNGALDFIRNYVKSKCVFLDYFNDTLALANLNRFATCPSLSDVKRYSSFRFYNNGTVSHLAEPKPLLYYMIHIHDLKKDFYWSRWRIGFMKKLFVLPLPYNAVMRIIMSCIKR